MLISGLPDIDVEDMKKNTMYEGTYTEESNVIKWFWKAAESFSQEERARLVQFITGSSKVPVGGFIHDRLKICHISGGDRRLPSAHTCFKQLDLPNYSTYEILREKLLFAINEGGEEFNIV